MTSLQEYLNNKYPNPEEVKEITASEITEQLEGGELDLSAFTNLEKLELDPNLLTTPLTKLMGFIKLKEIDWLETRKETEEEKKLYEELGVSDNLEQKKVIQEVQRLAELKKIQVHFGRESAAEGLEEEDVFLLINKQDKQGNFSPNLVFWNLAQELSLMDIGEDKTTKSPKFWTNFYQQLEWVKENLAENYQKEFEKLLKPSTFPTDNLEIKEFFTFYYPNLENITDSLENKTILERKIVDQTWQTIQKELLELTEKELSKSPNEEQLKELAFKILIECSGSLSISQHYTLRINYHSNLPFKEKVKELFTNLPLQLENELLKEEKKQLPTLESFGKLKEQIRVLEDYLRDLTDEEEFKKIKEKIARK